MPKPWPDTRPSLWGRMTGWLTGFRERQAQRMDQWVAGEPPEPVVEPTPPPPPPSAEFGVVLPSALEGFGFQAEFAVTWQENASPDTQHPRTQHPNPEMAALADVQNRAAVI